MTESSSAELAADAELSSRDRPEQQDSDTLDDHAREAVRKALPEWDVQPFQMSRAIVLPGGVSLLRDALDQVEGRSGRVPDLLVTGDRVVVRVRTDGASGLTQADVDLAAEIDPVLSKALTTDGGASRTPSAGSDQTSGRQV